MTNVAINKTPETEITPEDIEPTGGFSALRQPGFAKYLGTLALSMTGMWVRITAMGYLVYDLTDDPFKLGVVSFVQSAPQVLLSPIAGAYIDRMDRRKLLIGVQLTILTAMLLLTYMIATGSITYGRLLAIAAIIGSMATFDWPARLSLVPRLVHRKFLASAVALNSAVFNAAKVAGPAFGGWLIAAVGMTAAFGYIALVAVPFIIVLITMRHLSGGPKTTSSGPRPKPWQTLVAGYKYMWRTPDIRAMLSVDIIPIVLGMSYIGMAPAVARDVLGLGAGGLGLMLTFNGVGSLAGTLLVARISSSARHRGMMVLYAILTFSVALIIFGLSSEVWLSFAVITLLGMAYAFSSTMNDTLIQLRVDDEYRGRVMLYSTFWGFSPAGALLAGFLANYIGVQWAVAVNGFLVLAYMPYLWLATPMRSID